MGRPSACAEAYFPSHRPPAVIKTAFGFSGIVWLLSRLLRGMQLVLKAIIAVVCQALLWLSDHARAFVSQCGQLLTASPLPNVPRASGYPVLGILPQMCNQGLFSSTMTTLFELAEDCGLSCSSVGPIPIVYLRDPTVIRQVFGKNSESITRFGHDGNGPFSINQRMIGDVASIVDGEDWRRLRNGFLRDLNNPTALRRTYGDICRIAQRHVQYMLSAKEGFDLCKAMEAYAFDGVWFVALGIENAFEYAGDLVEVLARYGKLVGDPSHLWRHGLRNMVTGKSFREPDWIERAIRRDIDQALQGLLSQNPGGLDFTDSKSSLLAKASVQAGASRDDVLSQARQIFSLGHDATALALFWCLYELDRHPDKVLKLRKELKDYGCADGQASFDKLRSMPYLDAVVTELFRLHPPITTTARRVTQPILVETRNQKTTILPRGTQLFSSVYLLHRDKQVWGADADTFVPERWLDIKANSLENRCEYLPFLTGPRACPSAGFVLLQIKTLLAALLARADVGIPLSSRVEKLVGGVIRPAAAVGYEVREITTEG